MKTTVVLCCLLAVAMASDGEWESFKTKFGRRYKSPTEEAFRKKIFLNNKMHVDQQNQRHAEGKATFTMAINQFADLTTHEFSERFNGYKKAQRSEENVKILSKSTEYPVDWRTSGCVTGVKDQKKIICHSSYAFAVTGCTEFYNCRNGQGLSVLSEQNIIDCTYSTGNQGCTSGSTDVAFQYAISNGINTEVDYPYTGTSQTGNCRFKTDGRIFNLTGVFDVECGSEDQLQFATDLGVVAADVDGSSVSFQLYSSGVYSNVLCSSTNVQQSVLIVGYDTDLLGGPYWLVKNSFGTGWGEGGYIRMARNLGNNCGIATHARYPYLPA